MTPASLSTIGISRAISRSSGMVTPDTVWPYGIGMSPAMKVAEQAIGDLHLAVVVGVVHGNRRVLDDELVGECLPGLDQAAV